MEKTIIELNDGSTVTFDVELTEEQILDFKNKFYANLIEFEWEECK